MSQFFLPISHRGMLFFALTIRGGVHTNFLRIRWLQFQNVDVVMAALFE